MHATTSQKGHKGGELEQVSQNTTRKIRFHKGTGSRIKWWASFSMPRAAQLFLLWGRGCANGDSESSIHSALQVTMHYRGSNLHCPHSSARCPLRGQHLCALWVITRLEVEAGYLTWFQRPPKKPPWDQIFLKSTGLICTQCTNSVSTQCKTITN